MDTFQHTIIIRGDETHVVDAVEPAPGLVLFRLPDGMAPNNPRRWRIGHKPSGLAIGDAMQRENGVAGIHAIADLADWTQTPDTIKAAVTDHDVFMALGRADCIEPNGERMNGDVSRNGTYTDADIKEAAREAVADQMDGFELLTAMAHTVPWMGLDTEPFNEAHARILALALAEGAAA
ncbi:hypothetical protein [Streptomyces wuyuanensis]|uniref:hypothetical protein n=1 Tax=Streptomyces wuyuanensis TaxID=1196353 RepID=UPI003412DC93